MTTPPSSAARLQIADLTVELGRRRVLRGDEELPLGKLTFDLLVALAERAPDVVTQDELAQRVWADRIVSPDTIAQRVKILRQALGDDAHEPRYVRVLRGQGYQLIPPVERMGAAETVRSAPLRDSQPRADISESQRAAGQGAADTSTQAQATRRWGQRYFPLLALGAVIAIAAVSAWVGRTLGPSAGPNTTAPTATRFEIVLPQTARPIGVVGLALPPDERDVVFASWNGRTSQLYRRSLGELGARPVPGTQGVGIWAGFSPDGEWIAFSRDDNLRKMPSGGGPSVTLASIEESERLPGGGLGLWVTNETLLWSGISKLHRFSAAGGRPTVLTIESSDEADHLYLPSDVLPDRRSVLVTRLPWPVGRGDVRGGEIAVVSLETGEVEVLLSEGRRPHYVASGHLVFWREGTLRAAPFDAATAALTGEPVPVVAGLELHMGATFPWFDLSENGSLLYSSASPTAERRELVWVDRDGGEERLAVSAQPYGIPRVSPIDERLIVQIEDEDFDLWVYDRALQPLTSGPGEERDPVWSPDGQRIAYFATEHEEGPGVFVRPADGTGEPERLSAGGTQLPQSWSPDGRYLVLAVFAGLRNPDTHFISLDDETARRPLASTPGIAETEARISPNGRWLAFESDEAGAQDIWVQAFPAGGRRYRISREGGIAPVWSRDGQTLYYLTSVSDSVSEPRQLMAVSVNEGPPGTWSAPEAFMPWPYYTRGAPTDYDVASDGRFVAMKPLAETTSSTEPRLIFVQNWIEELERVVPTASE